MKKKTLWIAAAGVLALGLLGAGLVAADAAGGHLGNHEGHFGRIGQMIREHIAELDLSASQKDQIRTIASEERPGLRESGEAVFTARRDLRAAIHADAFDEGAVRAASQKVAAAEEEFSVKRARMASRIRAVLDPEQRKKADAMRERFEGHLDRFREEMPSHVDELFRTL